jgi:hypothetical protein
MYPEPPPVLVADLGLNFDLPSISKILKGLRFKILLQYDANIAFLLGFGMAMQYLYKFQKICYRTQRILGILY